MKLAIIKIQPVPVPPLIRIEMDEETFQRLQQLFRNNVSIPALLDTNGFAAHARTFYEFSSVICDGPTRTEEI